MFRTWCRKLDQDLRILMFIAHEDEEKAMKELGLLQGIDLQEN